MATMNTTTRTITCTGKLTKAVHKRLDAFLRQQTDLWNGALQERIDAYRKCQKSITVYDQQKSLTEIRNADTDYKQYSATAQRSSLHRLDKAFKKFLANVKAGKTPGFPKFKSRRNRVKSFDIPKPVTFKDNAVFVKGIGKIQLQQPKPEGTILMARVIRTPLRVEVQFVVEHESEPRDIDEMVGIDVGVKERAILSTGEMLPRVTIDRSRLKRLQRKLSRAVKGSNSYYKKKDALAREYRRVALRERNALHRATTKIVAKHNNIALEDIQVQNLTKSAKGTVENPGKNVAQKSGLNRSILEQQWGAFGQQLDYKTDSAGGQVVRVPAAYTSQECHVCGHRQKMPLQTRTYRCESCGQESDRDINAAKNILRRGITAVGGLTGQGLPDANKKEVQNCVR